MIIAKPKLARLLLLLGLGVFQAHAETSVDVRQGDLRVVLQQLADSLGQPLLLGDSVQGQASLHLRRQSPRVLFDALLAARGLVSEVHGPLLWVGLPDELATRNRNLLAWQQSREQIAPVQTRLLALQQARAADIARLLSSAGSGERLLGPRGRAEVDARTNTLLLTDTSERLDQVASWLATLDRPTRQVVIETRLAAISRTHVRDLGAKWKLARDALAGQTGLGVPGAEVAVISYGLLGMGSDRLDVELSALEANGHGEVIARPRLMTAELQKARIASGQQIPYQETTYSGATATRFINAELSLEVTPFVAPDGQIQLDLQLSHDSAGEVQGNGARAIDTNRLATQVRLRDGQTLVLGGIFRSQDTQTVRKVPGLGNIPIMGQLFRRQIARRDRQELLVFVTPRLLTDTAADALPTGPDGRDDESGIKTDERGQPVSGGADGGRQDDDRSSAG